MDRKKIIISKILIAAFLLFPVFGQSEYQVQPGDTIYGVSKRFDVEPALLMEMNKIKDPSQLRAGQILKIPESYEVQPGDTYYGIARKLGIPVSRLLLLNGRNENSILLAGDVLQIPREGTAPESGGKAAVAAQGSQGSQGSQGAQESVQKDPAAVREVDFFWPHGGTRTNLTGKLEGAQFVGVQGDSVFSVSSGKVIWVAPYRGYNKLIIVEAPDTHIYAYGGNDLALVTVGDQVFPGMEIGRLGINPHEGEAKAFFFVYKNGVPVDPAKAPRT